MKTQDIIAIVAGVIFITYGLWHRQKEKDKPRQVTITWGIGKQILGQVVTTNRYGVWQTTSNGPSYKTPFGTWTVRLPECYDGVTIVYLWFVILP